MLLSSGLPGTETSCHGVRTPQNIFRTNVVYLSSCFHAASAGAVLLFTGLDECCCLGLCGLKRVSNACVKQLPVEQTANLAEANASEEDKIKAMMTQSGHEYDPIK